MISRLALRPDLEECLLEDRLLLYAPGLQASQFIPTGGFSPAFIVSGFSQSNSGPGSGGGVAPGPQYFYLTIGLASISNGGVRLGGTPNIYNPGSLLPSVQGPAIGSGPGSGQGSSISSGYNTALSSSNNYGMGPSALGSVTAHISGTTDQLAEAMAANNPSAPNAVNQDTSAPSAPPPNAAQGPLSPQDRLLGKGLGGSGGLLIGPGTSNPSMMSPKR